MNFLRPGRPDAPLLVTAEVVHRGRSVTIARATTTGPDGKAYTTATITRLVSRAPD
jgi:acyl-coenzyme A thioesterase PaaI-like protein